MDIHDFSRKDIGDLGERVAAEYLLRNGFQILGRNIQLKIGELDIIALKDHCLHIIEVKSIVCSSFPGKDDTGYSPADNLHQRKIRTVRRAAQWYVAGVGWNGEWQIDAVLVWLREQDSMARVEYYPQIL